MINELLMNTLKDIAPTYPDFSTAMSLKEYIVFEYSISPLLFADDGPEYNSYRTRVYYVCPSKANRIETRKRIIRALSEIGTYPEETNASTNEYQEYVYDFEVVEKAICM